MSSAQSPDMLFRFCHPERSASACERAVSQICFFRFVILSGARTKASAQSKDLCTLRDGITFTSCQTGQRRCTSVITGKFTLRVFQHKTGVFKGFTSRYRMDRLVYWEKFKRVNDAIAREKQLKSWTRNQENSADCRHEPDVGRFGRRLVPGVEGKRKCIDPSTARSHALPLRSG